MIGEEQVQAMEYLQKYSGMFNEMAKESIARMVGGQSDEGKPSLPNTEQIMSLVSQSVTLNPKNFMREHMNYMDKHSQLLQAAAKAISGESFDEVAKGTSNDRRFRDNEWTENPFFNYVRQSYLINANFFKNVVDSLEFENAKDAQQARFFTRQYINSLSPTNYVLTNPEVCREIIDTKGDSIVRGMDKFFKDLDNSPAEAFKINQVDIDAYELGEDLATTPGKVIFKNDLIELIQYQATTETVHATPLLIVPPFINKYYILDLDEKKSIIRWLVNEGFSVFVVSWINPDASLAQKGLSHYIHEGVIKAIDVACEKTKQPKVHVAGYCIGGTLLSITQSYLAANDQDKVASLTFLTTLFDFSDPGEVGNYLSENSFPLLEQSAQQKGYFDGRVMAMSFSLLRENNLFWSFFVENYLKGKDQTPFDILYWNGDSTNIAAQCFIEFVKNMYVENNLIKPGVVMIDDTPIDLSNIDVPVYCLATIQDHIVPWQSAYNSAKVLGGSVRFVVAGSGHVAGVINPVEGGKYPHWVNNETPLPASEQQWMDGAIEQEGSWWSDWKTWLVPLSGKSVKARQEATKGYPGLANAPGDYVKVRLEQMNSRL